MIKELLPDPNTPEFWPALDVLLMAASVASGGLAWFVQFLFGRTPAEKAMVRALVRLYIDWVSVHSKREVIDAASLREWLEDSDEVLRFGKSYGAFSKFTKTVERRTGTPLGEIEKDEFFEIHGRVISKLRWSRCEW